MGAMKEFTMMINDRILVQKAAREVRALRKAGRALQARALAFDARRLLAGRRLIPVIISEKPVCDHGRSVYA